MKQLAQQINTLIGERRVEEAEKLSQRLISEHPLSEAGWIQLARICQLKDDFEGMLNSAQKALTLSPDHLIALLQEVEALILLAQIEPALDKLAHLEMVAAHEPEFLRHVAVHYTHIGKFDASMRVYKQAHSIMGDDVGLLYDMANTAIALGQQDEAEHMLDLVIGKMPHDYAAYYNRSTFRKQTADNNHTVELKSLLKNGLKTHDGEVPIGYALSKEYEDLGDYEQAFEYLKLGADRRKTMLSYDVAGDVETMQEIARVMQGDFFANMPPANDQAGPIFVLGMPRSGTTLVDRILCSHSKIVSLGEINDLVIEMMKLAPKATDKVDLISKTKDINFNALAKAYTNSTNARDDSTAYRIDKTPANFLYIGLIAMALPNAKIIHLRRTPMDSCYAMYKTLFGMGYPFSYDLDDLAQYYIAYHELMAHWRTQLPNRILDLDYENLVADQEAQSRRLIEHVGLNWEDACLDFHENKSASATASAAQIRQPIYKTSVEKWRHYETQLTSLSQALSVLDADGKGHVNG